MIADMRPAVRAAIFKMAKARGVRPQELAGEVLELFVVESFADTFPEMTFEQFCRLVRLKVRVA